MSSSSNLLAENGDRKKKELPDRRIPSRPTTPLRSSSRVSGKSSSGYFIESSSDIFEPAFAELSDSMVDLEANMMHLQLMQESLSRFNENFCSFLYGLHMNAFCVDFPEAPIPESFHRACRYYDSSCPKMSSDKLNIESDGDTTFMCFIMRNKLTDKLIHHRTTDTSFIENPPVSSNIKARHSTLNSNFPSQRHSSHNTGSRTTGRIGLRGPMSGGSIKSSKFRGGKD